MFRYGSKADIAIDQLNVRFTPKSGHSLLFNHLVGECQQLVGNLKAKRLGGGQIENEIESGRLFDWNVGGLGTVQNLVHQVRGAAPHTWPVRPVGYQTPSF